MRKRFLILSVIGILLSSVIAYAQTDAPAKSNGEDTKVLKKMILFPSGEMFKQNIKILSVRLVDQKVPQDIVEDVTAKVDITQLDEIAQKAYSKYFTAEEAKAISDFYASPAGKKFNETMPLLMQEYLYQYGSFSYKVYEQIFDELAKKGYPLDDLRNAYLAPAKVSVKPAVGSTGSPATDVKKEEKK